MQLYLTALAVQVKLPEENPLIGIIICRSRYKTFVKYALKQSNVPIGVTTYQLSKCIAEEYERDVARVRGDCEETKVI